MKKYLTILFIALAVTACKKTEFEPEGPTDVRINNISDQAFSEMTVKIKDETMTYGNLAKGATSDYQRFQTAFPKAEITAKINGVTFTTGTVDYTYLQYLGQVRITYKVWISDFNARKLEINDVVYEEPLVLK